MCLISYHVSHEQFGPVELLGYVQQAEAAGFTAIHSSDHFHPWSKRQGESGFALSWLPVAMQVCKLPFSMVCAPGQRLHPAIVAQAFATISLMFPDRLIVELGSSEALNESVTGEEWPEKAIRNVNPFTFNSLFVTRAPGRKPWNRLMISGGQIWWGWINWPISPAQKNLMKQERRSPGKILLRI